MAKSKPPKPPGQYDVGYGRPPVHSRFQPGQSGNPAGRQKGQPTPNEIFMKEAARLVKIKRGDTVETITKHGGDRPQAAAVGDGRRHRGGALGLFRAGAERARPFRGARGGRDRKPRPKRHAGRRDFAPHAGAVRASAAEGRGGLIHERGRRSARKSRPAFRLHGRRRTPLDQTRPVPV